MNPRASQPSGLQAPRLSSLLLALALFAAAAVPARARETPTEREAAREVLQKMAALETALDVPAMVATLSAPNAQRDAVAARAKALMDTELLALSDDICTHPEIGYKETRSVQKLAEALRTHDFDVTIGAGTLDTPFVAKFKGNNGKPDLGVIVEYDALTTAATATASRWRRSPSSRSAT